MTKGKRKQFEKRQLKAKEKKSTAFFDIMRGKAQRRKYGGGQVK